MNDDLDRTIAEGLRRRADSMPMMPLGMGDVQRRITRRRQRTATLAAAAVMVPAVVGLGFLAGRRGDAQQAVGAPPETTILMATSTTMQPSAGPASYRCQGEVADDGVFTYYQYCEYIDPAAPPMTTTFVTIPQPTTTTIDPQLPDGTLVVIDATGGLPVQEILESRGVAFSEVMPARRVVAQTMIMPIGDDTTQAERLAELVPVGGFDTWDSTLIDGPVPDGVTAVLVLGADALDYHALTTTTVTFPCSLDAAPETTSPALAPTTTSC